MDELEGWRMGIGRVGCAPIDCRPGFDSVLQGVGARVWLP